MSRNLFMHRIVSAAVACNSVNFTLFQWLADDWLPTWSCRVIMILFKYSNILYYEAVIETLNRGILSPLFDKYSILTLIWWLFNAFPPIQACFACWLRCLCLMPVHLPNFLFRCTWATFNYSRPNVFSLSTRYHSSSPNGNAVNLAFPHHRRSR